MPYNYLIDANIRERFELGFANSIIIFDEAHNVAPVAEEVSSFELKAKSLDEVLTELHSLRECMSMEEDKMWKASREGIEYIKSLTERFVKYLRKLSLDLADNPKAIQGVSSNRHMPEKSIVLPGEEIFNIFFDGANGEDLKASGETYVQSLTEDWDQIKQYFEDALNDISEISKDKVKSQIEGWFDILQKVMKLWALGKTNQGGLNSKLKAPGKE